MLAQDLFGSTIQDIIDVENEVLTSTDEEIYWEAPVHDIIEQLNENDNNEDVESDIDEDMVPPFTYGSDKVCFKKGLR